MDGAMLQPVAALLAWSLVMLVWMYATRIPAMIKADIDLKNRVGGQGSDLDGILPREIQWKAHNYNHLMEQPTLFYAACITLALLGVASQLMLGLAWAYVGLRVAHSLVQSTSNRIRYRFALFLLASLALAGLILGAVKAAFGG
jgi:hypothetical protein